MAIILPPPSDYLFWLSCRNAYQISIIKKNRMLFIIHHIYLLKKVCSHP